MIYDTLPTRIRELAFLNKGIWSYADAMSVQVQRKLSSCMKAGLSNTSPFTEPEARSAPRESNLR